jgi:hypothetical protein
MELTSTIVKAVVEVLLTVALPFLLARLFQWLAQELKVVRSKLSIEQLALLSAIASMAVTAAQQSGLAGLIENIGTVKKQYAIQIVQSYLDSKGIDMDVSVIEAAIEAAVKNAMSDFWDEWNTSSPRA